MRYIKKVFKLVFVFISVFIFVWYKLVNQPLIIDVPLICQYPTLPTGCESVGATMLLQYYGIDVDEITFASNWLDTSDDFYKLDETQYGPDPNEVFVGNPFSEYSYGCFSSVILNAINHHQNQVTAHIILDKTLEELCIEYINHHQPVLIWATMRMKPLREGNSWYLPSNKLFTWPAGEHCLVLVGYDDYRYYLNDPQTGTIVSYRKKVVQERFEELHSQALVITK